MRVLRHSCRHNFDARDKCGQSHWTLSQGVTLTIYIYIFKHSNIVHFCGLSVCIPDMLLESVPLLPKHCLLYQSFLGFRLIVGNTCHFALCTSSQISSTFAGDLVLEFGVPWHAEEETAASPQLEGLAWAEETTEGWSVPPGGKGRVAAGRGWPRRNFSVRASDSWSDLIYQLFMDTEIVS